MQPNQHILYRLWDMTPGSRIHNKLAWFTGRERDGLPYEGGGKWYEVDVDCEKWWVRISVMVRV